MLIIANKLPFNKMNYIIPVIIISIILYAFTKKVSVYDSFIGGVKDSLKLVLSIMPYIITISVMLELFRVSGLSSKLTALLSPTLNFLGIPPELTELIVLRPLSGNGTITLLKDLFNTYSADSYISRVASVIVGSSDTIFYIAVVYFSGTKIKNLSYGIPVALLSTFVGTITACYICQFI